MKKVFILGATSLIVIALSGFSTISDFLNREQSKSQSNIKEETTFTEKEQEVSEETTEGPLKVKAELPEFPYIGPPVGPQEGGTEGTLVDNLEEPLELTDNVYAEGTYIRQIDSASVEIKVDGEVKVFYLLKGFSGYGEGIRIRFSYGTNKDGLNFITVIKQ
ncbi:MAG TPA: hypothetical protein VEV44_15830 [Pseudoneobacillus sp.]|nr:hypothetical protein [Pseudoneobacillus sp.]